ncbi:toprim domain-containing protein [Paenibacillus dendritiformis]|uniref:toprim domain-containing protein n=1 Tax=Paenibacillus dendritiformis TaxID=130049 RepID=UPI00387E107B
MWLEDNDRFNAKAGQFGDDGAPDEWKRGSFVKLLAFLRHETEEETREYLRYTYETEWTSEEEITLTPPKLRVSTTRKPLDIGLLDQYAYRHPYLAGRGISEAVQRAYHVGYDRARQAVTIPWFLPDGRLGNVMYRSVNSKIFWFAKVCLSCGHGHLTRDSEIYRCRDCTNETTQPIEGMPIRGMLYGIDVIYRRRVKRVALVEAPIDALYLVTCGIPAVATGGASFNEEKRDLLIRSGVEELTVFHDNDGGAGVDMQREVIDQMSRYMTIRTVTYPPGKKDPTDVGDPEVVRKMSSESTKVSKKLYLEI